MPKRGDNPRAALNYGPVFAWGGRHKGKVFYYDDDDTDKTGVCYAGHPGMFPGSYLVQTRFLREPTVDDLLKRHEAVVRKLSKVGLDGDMTMESHVLHDLWAEKSLIDDALYEWRMFGSQSQLSGPTKVFLCHSSDDKGKVRMVHDDLCRRNVTCWLDENKIKVGDSIVSKVSEGLATCPTMIAFLSPSSVKSIWARKEWQSFLARQLSGTHLKILPALLESCEIPEILADIKYADFRDDYHNGLMEIFEALK